ncbi:hypothetical protein NA56DRAFT_708711 [Hyaloscypha hepaticicola]|uniref:Uncharacterized protein n=1 Tax=Hyaloscypha hepaticicola TaxID=2082293 RepID=A0A2J6PR43_9HELO|nr:hypothetical protein NA56DRAFT_708711 [Hyaloscypha hepaticicola]
MFWFNGESDLGGIFCVAATASVAAWDPARVPIHPHFPLHNFFFIRDLQQPQTVRPGTCERVGLECRKGEDGEKRRAERPGSDTRRDKTPFKRVMELSDWRLWAETVDRLATEIGGASEIRQG